MITSYHRPTKAIIHNEAIRKNVANAVERLPKDKELFAVVKADGYGHGAIETAHAAVSGGAKGFCVATLDEGIQLREAGFLHPILILEPVEPSYILLAADYQLSVTAATLEWLEKVAGILAERRDYSNQLSLHIKIDSGMGRIGFTSSDSLKKAVQQIQNDQRMTWDGIYTHFATADSPDSSYWEEQKERFSAMLADLPCLPRYVHVANSATALWHSEEIGNMVRFGVAMYGLNPSGNGMELDYPLYPAMELVSQLSQVKKVPQAARIGYGATYTSSEEEWIGTVPIGYADGWLRRMQGFSVLVDGKFCEIVGRVCMDQIMIRLPKAYGAGTKVTLIGENGGEIISMQEVADYLDTIHYEVACTISGRIPREYKK